MCSKIVAVVIAVLALPALAPFGAAPAAQAQAQAPQATRTNIRGTIAKLDGQNLIVKSRDGMNLTIALAPHPTVRTLVHKKLSDIHEGDFVGTTSIPGKDGKLHAVEIHFFPADLKIPDSQNPWDLRAGAMMTNAHVQGVAKAAHGQILSVNYNNRVTQVVVDRQTKIVAPAPKPGTLADLKPGKAVYLTATKSPDGTLTAANVTVEKNGIKPPM